jgi:BirA family biotin operon repressor/biotin-[acetyl-CoA-carboxylase] ligase
MWFCGRIPFRPVGGPVNWNDLDRPPLSATRLRRDLAPDGFDLQIVERTASTNADLAEAARRGAPEGTVLLAESQEAGRGRLGRTWMSPPRAGLTYSVLFRPPADRPTTTYGWLPLLAGLSLVVALREHAGIEAALKWPNDVVLVDPDTDGSERKVAGILSEVVTGADEPAPAVVIGVGLNVTTRAEEFAALPSSALTPTSLLLGGSRTTDREIVLKAHLRVLARTYAAWRSEPGSLAPLYRSVCRTLGGPVRVELPGGDSLSGTATDIDDEGRLLVTDPAGAVHALAAGDVVHLRRPGSLG